MSLPDRVKFEGYVGTYAYRIIAHRAPKRGEFYLSGAVVSAWRAPNDLATAYAVVVPKGPLCRTFPEYEGAHLKHTFKEYE